MPTQLNSNGRTRNMDILFVDIADKYNSLFEDAAQGLGLKFKNKVQVPLD